MLNNLNNTQKELWIVDDDPAEVFLLKRALQDPLCALPPNYTIKSSTDGRKTMDLLTDAANQNQLPRLMVLDLNMPGIDGFDVLAFCQKDTKLKSLSIAVVTTASEPSILERALELGATSVHTKPHTAQEAIEILSDVVERYL
jgi:chemotaxis family two-component system response regulator Rcp1